MSARNPALTKIAHQILQALHSAGGKLNGSMAIAEAIGLPTSPEYRARVKLIVQYAMPIAVELCPTLYPGMSLIVRNDRSYNLRARLVREDMAAILRRERSALASARRSYNELVIANMPTQHGMRELLAAALSMLERVELLMAQELQRLGEAAEAA